MNLSRGDRGHDKLKEWYTKAIQEMRKVDPGVPIFISDCWRTDDYAAFISFLPSSPSMIILDHHLYRCFTSSDIHTHISQHSHSLRDAHSPTPQLFERISSKLASCASDFVVGEWSGALNPGSTNGLGYEEETNARREYINAQLALYEQYCGGWFFWTYKKERSGDQGWSLRDAVVGGVFPNALGMTTVTRFDGDCNKINNRRNVAEEKILGEFCHKLITKINQRNLTVSGDHTVYWSQYPGKYEHWRFAEGFIRGWDDAYLFFASVCATEGRLRSRCCLNVY